MTQVQTPEDGARAAALLEHALDGLAAFVAVLDGEGRVSLLRGGLVRSGAVSPAAWVGQPCPSVLGWKAPDAASIEAAISAAREGTTSHFEAIVVGSDGGDVHLRVAVAPHGSPPTETFLLTGIHGADEGDGDAPSVLSRHARSDLRLRLALEAGQMGLWTWRIADERVTLDGIQGRLWGLDSDRVTARDLMKRIVPEDRPVVEAEVRRAEAEGDGADFACEFRVTSGGGEIRWLANRAMLVGTGDAATLRGVTYDVTHRHEAEASRNLLLAELSHRVRNMLAVVQGVANLSKRRAPSVDAYVAQLNARLLMLAHAFDLLVGSDWRGVRLPDLVKRVLGSVGDRVTVRVADASVGPALAQSLALVFHELSSNSLVHGALSTASGTVDLDIDGSGDVLSIVWHERGGPAVQRPTASGFGMVMIERALRDQHKADVTMDWSESGLVYRATLPVLADAPRAAYGLATRAASAPSR